MGESSQTSSKSSEDVHVRIHSQVSRHTYISKGMCVYTYTPDMLIMTFCKPRKGKLKLDRKIPGLFPTPPETLLTGHVCCTLVGHPLQYM